MPERETYPWGDPIPTRREDIENHRRAVMREALLSAQAVIDEVEDAERLALSGEDGLALAVRLAAGYLAGGHR